MICFAILFILSIICRSQTIPVITDKSQLDSYVGKFVIIKGLVTNTKIPTILGVDISSDNHFLKGKYAKAEGLLIKWTIKPEDTDSFSQSRNPGIYYRLKETDSDLNAMAVEASKPIININTVDSTVLVDNEILNISDLKNIQKYFGEPDRIKRDENKSSLTEYPHNRNEEPRSYPVKYINYYFIYDNLGLIFYSDNSYSYLNEEGETQYKKPVAMLVKFNNNRLFDHDKPFTFMPNISFSGLLYINGVLVNPTKKAFPENVNYQTNVFNLYNVLFYPTSYTTIIDGLYSKNSWPYIIIMLDEPIKQRPSYVIIR